MGLCGGLHLLELRWRFGVLDRACAHLSRPARLRCLAANRNARAFYERNGWVAEAPPAPLEDSFILYRK